MIEWHLFSNNHFLPPVSSFDTGIRKGIFSKHVLGIRILFFWQGFSPPRIVMQIKFALVSKKKKKPLFFSFGEIWLAASSSTKSNLGSVWRKQGLYSIPRYREERTKREEEGKESTSFKWKTKTSSSVALSLFVGERPGGDQATMGEWSGSSSLESRPQIKLLT